MHVFKADTRHYDEMNNESSIAFDVFLGDCKPEVKRPIYLGPSTGVNRALTLLDQHGEMLIDNGKCIRSKDKHDSHQNQMQTRSCIS
jgi:hypothetical protein